MISYHHIVRRRDETKPVRVCVKDFLGVDEDIDGATFRLTVSREPYPNSVDNQLFRVDGNIVDGDAGIVDFPIGGVNAGYVGFFYFDIEMIDPAGLNDTIVFGWYHVKQDITKTAQSLTIASAGHGTA